MCPHAAIAASTKPSSASGTSSGKTAPQTTSPAAAADSTQHASGHAVCPKARRIHSESGAKISFPRPQRPVGIRLPVRGHRLLPSA